MCFCVCVDKNPKHCKDRRWLQSVGAFPSLFNFTLCAFAILMLFLTFVGIEIVSYRNRTAFFLFFFIPLVLFLKPSTIHKTSKILFCFCLPTAAVAKNPRNTETNSTKPKNTVTENTAYSKSQFHFFLVFFFFFFFLFPVLSFFAEEQFSWYHILQGVGAPEASEHKDNLKR